MSSWEKALFDKKLKNNVQVYARKIFDESSAEQGFFISPGSLKDDLYITVTLFFSNSSVLKGLPFISSCSGNLL
jgi:hypothetical protein